MRSTVGVRDALSMIVSILLMWASLLVAPAGVSWGLSASAGPSAEMVRPVLFFGSIVTMTIAAIVLLLLSMIVQDIRRPGPRLATAIVISVVGSFMVGSVGFSVGALSGLLIHA